MEELVLERKTQNGFLVLADISGYTSYVAQTELEHADLAISCLLEAIVKRLGRYLTISKLEGDAVFAYVEDGKIPPGKTLLDLVDDTYMAFRMEANKLYSKSTCPCRACQAIPTLDLKFIVHYGDFLIQQVAGIRDLLGTDVNLVHRLLKNHVADATGWRGYALFTGQGLERIQVDRTPFVHQAESYEHLGEVETYLMDLHVRYGQMKSSQSC
jgi:hypothetical protein